MTAPGKLDVHAHYLPGTYREALVRAGHEHPDGMPAIPSWSADEHVALMDRLGIATSLLSISTPGVHLAATTDAIDLARDVNEAGRRAVVDHPGRFGLLGSLPLPDVDAAIAEIAHCIDHLDVDGFVLLTHIDGTYLGDPVWDPVFRELDRRKARVLIHPTSPVCWEHTSLGRPRPMLEFLFDTTRAVVNLVLNGTVARHDNLRFVIPHAGATLPVIADRVALFALALGTDPSVDVLRDLAGLHYDLSGTPIPRQLDALLAITTLDHLHYGSDYPFTPDFVAARAFDALDAAGDPSNPSNPSDSSGSSDTSDPSGSLADALRANTQQLFPQLAARL